MNPRESRSLILKKKTYDGDALAESLRLPRDAVLGETLLTAIGKNTLRVENYRSILIYSDTSIKLQAKRYKLSIFGRNLKIRYYDKDEMEIVGQIEDVKFE